MLRSSLRTHAMATGIFHVLHQAGDAEQTCRHAVQGLSLHCIRAADSRFEHKELTP